MKLSKSELLEILLEVIKNDYCLGKLGTILEIIDCYVPKEPPFYLGPVRRNSDSDSDSILLSDEEEEEPQHKTTTMLLSSDSEDESSDESSVGVYLTEGEESSN